MPSKPANSQVRVYFGADGQPLNNGYIYFGQAGLEPQANPLQVTWDAAGLLPAAQPLRTIGGYISRNGQPANVFATGDFSSTVYDSKMRLIYTTLNNVDFTASGTTAASDVSVADTGGFFTGTDVEAALQEVGTSLASLATGNVPTGAMFDYCGTTAPAGFVLAGGGTIGNVASNATQRNNADTATLYTLLWNSSSNTELIIQDSAGTPTTRGANAAADFAAAKRLPLPDLRGRVRAGKDDMGVLGTASRITNAGAGIVGTTQFAVGGTETHVLTLAQLAAHTHTLNSHTHTIAHTHTLSAHTHTIAHTHDMTHTHTVAAGVFAGAFPNAGAGDNAGAPVTTSGPSPSNTGGSSAANSGSPSSDFTGGSSAANSGGPSTANTASSGTDTAHLNVQPTIMFTVIIKL